MRRTVFVEERRDEILEILKQKKRVQVKDLARKFVVSNDLIRKDLAFLEKQGVLQKTYGGAILKMKLSDLHHYKERLAKRDHNEAIAACAVDLVQDGDTIFIEASTMTYPLFSLLKVKKNLIVMTNSIHHVTELLPTATVIQTGGLIHKSDQATYGKFALDTIKNMTFDKCFLTTSGVTQRGVLTSAIEENMALKQTTIEQAHQTVVMVPWDKWERHGMYNVCSLDQVEVVVTDTTNEDVLSSLKESQVKLMTPMESDKK